MDGFHDLGLAFGREEEDEDNDSNGLRERDEDKGMTMMTTTTVAMKDATLKDDEIRNSLPVAATAMALQNVLSAPPRPADIRKRLELTSQLTPTLPSLV